MRFMLLMIPSGYNAADPGTIPDAEAVRAMGHFNEELAKAGVLLDLNGLCTPAEGARVTFKAGKPSITDGPFAEAKEVVGGYWIIQVKSKAEAIEWASRCPVSGDDTIEVRQIFGFADFPDSIKAAVEDFPHLKAFRGDA